MRRIDQYVAIGVLWTALTVMGLVLPAGLPGKSASADRRTPGNGTAAAALTDAWRVVLPAQPQAVQSADDTRDPLIDERFEGSLNEQPPAACAHGADAVFSAQAALFARLWGTRRDGGISDRIAGRILRC